MSTETAARSMKTTVIKHHTCNLDYTATAVYILFLSKFQYFSVFYITLNSFLYTV